MSDSYFSKGGKVPKSPALARKFMDKFGLSNPEAVREYLIKHGRPGVTRNQGYRGGTFDELCRIAGFSDEEKSALYGQK